MRAAARRLKNKPLTAEVEMAGRHGNANDQYRDEQMNVERVGVARETSSPRSSYARQPGTLTSQVDQFCTIREAITTRSHDFDRELEAVLFPDNFSRKITTTANTRDTRAPAGPDASAAGVNAEGKYAAQFAVMTGTLLTNDFEVLIRSRESLVEETNWEQAQLTEVMVVENQRQRLMEERWIRATVAVKDVDGAMLDEILREIEELDESYKLSDEDKTIIDALLEELELENADQDGGERSEFLDVDEVPVPYTGVYKLSVECICDVTKVTVRSETEIEAEGNCSFQSTGVDCSHERHYCQIPEEATPQRPTPTERSRFWVPHRKHCRRKTENQQMGLRGLCWPTHQKHGRWKPDKMVMPPLLMQPRPDGTRRWSSRRKRSRWKFVNRGSVRRGDTMQRCM